MDENQNNFNNENNNLFNVNQGYEPPIIEQVPTPATTNESIVNNGSNNVINNLPQESNKEPKKEKNKVKGPGFCKTVLLPFISGLIGAAVIIAVCVGVPSVRNVISGLFETPKVSNETPNNNTQKVLEDYSVESSLIAEKVLPSVVGIDVSLNVSSVVERNVSKALAEGSGIIVSEDGYIITNSHVVNPSTSRDYEVDGTSYIKVYLHNEDTPYTATVIGKDEEMRFARSSPHSTTGLAVYFL